MRANEKGFSLLEVLISLLILSIMMLGLYSMVDNGQRQKDTVTSEDQDYLQAQLALSRIDTDFSQIYSPLYYSAPQKQKEEGGLDEDDQKSATPFTPTDQFPSVTVSNHPVPVIQNPDKNTIIFFTASNRRKFQDAKEARWTWIQYTLKNKDKSRLSEEEAQRTAAADYDLIRLASPVNPFAESLDWDKVREQLMMKNVKSLLFQFWDKKRERWVDGLKEVPAEEQSTPRALRVTLEWLDSSGQEHTNTRVFRPLWPYFDTVKDELEKQNPKKGNNAEDGGAEGADEKDEDDEA